MAMPTRKPLKLLAIGDMQNARPYTTDAVRTKFFRAAVRSGSVPSMREAATMPAGRGSVPRNICCGTSALALPSLSSR